MICPRCGRSVGEAANFCGGCGMPKTEIITYYATKQEQPAAPVIPSAPQIPPVDINRINSTLSQLENDLNGTVPVTDYTTDTAKDTTEDIFTPSDFIRKEIESEKLKREENPYLGQSAYSAEAPKRPEFSYDYNTESYNKISDTSTFTAAEKEDEYREEPLSTVDFIWMMLLSSMPGVGFFYLVYLAFIQKNSKSKASFAKATFIISIFAFLMVFVFMAGLFATQAPFLF